MIIKVKIMKVELKIGVIIEAEDTDDFDFGDIGELVAADVYDLLNNGEDFLEVFYRGANIYEDSGIFS